MQPVTDPEIQQKLASVTNANEAHQKLAAEIDKRGYVGEQGFDPAGSGKAPKTAEKVIHTIAKREAREATRAVATREPVAPVEATTPPAAQTPQQTPKAVEGTPETATGPSTKAAPVTRIERVGERETRQARGAH